MAEQTRYIFISGGVISGLGKGIVAASLGMLLKDRGFRVACMKADAYLNVDAGTMNPIEHGEVFVTPDGLETDQDLGHYERFLNQDTCRQNYLTMGMIFEQLLSRERRLEFGGKCVEMVPHVPQAVIARIEQCAQHSVEDGVADFVIVEFGGTVGEYQTELFLEAARIMTKRCRGRVLHIHVAYFPFPEHLGEMKSKPAQLSLRQLSEAGVEPDFLVARSSARHTVDKIRAAKIAQNSNLDEADVIFCPDMDSIYQVPLLLHEQLFVPKLLRKLSLEVIPRPNLRSWKQRVEKLGGQTSLLRPLQLGIVSKYHGSGEYSLDDSYVSVIEALKHAGVENSTEISIRWIDAELLETDPIETWLSLDGLVVPQGWGARGAEGKIAAIRWAREQRIPYLGLCYGMQMALIEYGRNVVGLDPEEATSVEIDRQAVAPVIDYMQGQHQVIYRKDYGGTIRVGSYLCRLKPRSLLARIYGQEEITERHRHRCEFNGVAYRKQYEAAGLIFSGTSPDGSVVEAIELPESVHPFFVGVQYHPEYQSRFERPHPLFVQFLRACSQRRNLDCPQKGEHDGLGTTQPDG